MKKILKFLTAVILMFTLTGCASSQSYEELMALGSKAIAAENYEEAVMDYSKAIEIEPRQEDAYIQLAYAYHLLDDRENEIATWGTLIHEIPDVESGYINLASIYSGQGETDKALSLLQQIETEVPDSVYGRKRLIQARENQGLYDLAAETSRNLIEVLKNKPDDYQDVETLTKDELLREAYTNLIEELRQIPDEEQAKEVIQEFYEAYPDDENAVIYKAEVLADEGNLDEAKKLVDDAYEKNPSDALKNEKDKLDASSSLKGETFNIIGRIHEFNNDFINHDTSCTPDHEVDPVIKEWYGCGYDYNPGAPIFTYNYTYVTDPESGYAYLDHLTGDGDEYGNAVYDYEEQSVTNGTSSIITFDDGTGMVAVMENESDPEGVYFIMSTYGETGVNIYLDADYKLVSIKAAYVADDGQVVEDESQGSVAEIYNGLSAHTLTLLDHLEDFNDPINMDLSSYLDVSELRKLFSLTL